MAKESDPMVSPEQVEHAEQYRRRRDTAVLCPVFGDIEDSTRLLEQLGEVNYDDFRQAHDRGVRTIIERDADGAVLQTYGDGFLAVFSEPSTAVERCLEIQQQIEGPFRLRIGIDMGQVAVKRTSGIAADIFGRHVNRASRIESQAKPGSVLTSFSVYDSSVGWLRDSIDWTHSPPIQLRGFADPISLHEPQLLNDDRLLESYGSGDVANPGKSRIYRGRGQPKTRGFPESPSTVLVGGPPEMRGQAFDPFEEALLSIRSSTRPNIFRVFSKTRILWVDDFPDNNLNLATRLADAGLRIDNVLDTVEAITALRKKKFSAVISDMGRGGDSTAGLELLRQMRESDIQVPCLIFASPRSEAEHAIAAAEQGATICTSGTVSLLRSLAGVL